NPTESAAAPSGETGERAAELRGDVRDRLDPAHAGGTDEDPLVGGGPGDEQPTAVGRPGRAGERAGAGEQARWLRRRPVGVEEEHLRGPDDGELVRARREVRADDARERDRGRAAAAQEDESLP